MKFDNADFAIKAIRIQRKHKALFDRDTNFRGKQHDDKHAYRRKPKYNRWEMAE
jgi:hypothetical protein